LSLCDGSTGQALAYVYGRDPKGDAGTAKVLTLDEARRIASNIAKLLTLPAPHFADATALCGLARILDRQQCARWPRESDAFN
jgi:hypothetical protein